MHEHDELSKCTEESSFVDYRVSYLFWKTWKFTVLSKSI